jgi:hypothetical protein
VRAGVLGAALLAAQEVEKDADVGQTVNGQPLTAHEEASGS